MKAKMHEVRNIGTSLLFKINFAVQQVLRAGMWKSQTLFTSFSLRDVIPRSSDTFSVGPVVVVEQDV